MGEVKKKITSQLRFAVFVVCVCVCVVVLIIRCERGFACLLAFASFSCYRFKYKLQVNKLQACLSALLACLAYY